MNSLTIRASSRMLLRHPWQLVLALFGIVLGVAVVTAMDLAKHSALVSFERATVALFGRATHRISAPEGIPEAWYRKLRRHGFDRSRPVVEGMVRTDTGKALRLIGIEPLAERRFMPAWLRGLPQSEKPLWRRFLLEPGTVLMSRQTSIELDLDVDDRFRVWIDGQPRQLTLIGIYDPTTGKGALKPVLYADIATAQEVLGAFGRLHAIDLIIEDDARLQALQRLLPKDMELLTHRAATSSVKRMTHAFYINLTALSLLSLLVGAFLIYNTIGFMVVQRRRLFAILRMLGLTRREILAGVLGEAFLLGLIGSLLGIVIGIVLGRVMLSLLARTLNDVYFPLPAAELDISLWQLIKGVSLGLGATVIASLIPALEAAKTQPVTIASRSLLEHQSRYRSQRLAVGGLIFLLGGVMLLPLGNQLVLGFVALTLAILGCAMLTPAVIPNAMVVCQWLGGLLFGPLGRMPARSVTAALSRTGIAAAALMVAVATTIGMVLMIHSFRDSVRQWLERRLDADLYVYAAGSGKRTPLPRSLGQRIATMPEVMDVGSVRYRRLVTEAGFLRINAYQLPPSAFATFELVERTGQDPWQAFQQGNVMVSEAFANLRGLHAGDKISIPTPQGLRTFAIFAVFVDYNAGRGIVAMSRRVYDRIWPDDRVSTYWVYLRPGANTEEVKARLLRLSPEIPLEVTDNQALLQWSMRVFDRAFVVTGVLRWLATGVAFVGVFSALLALQLERSRELGVLRALGLTPGQLWLQIITETVLLGGIAGLVAMPVGLLMGWLLMEVINRRAFGWTLEFSPQSGDLLQGLALALMAALLAGLYPAWKMARTSPAQALRCE